METSTGLVTRPTSRPDRVAVRRVPLSGRQQAWIEAAWARLDARKALDLDVELTNIWSYSGHERELGEWVADHFERAGVAGEYQPMDSMAGNAIGRIKGDRSGPTLLLLAPCDSHFAGDPAIDGLQWGDPMRRDNRRPAVVEGQSVVGLSSENPKALCAAVIMAIEALAAARVQLRGNLVAALVAGGSPARSAPDEPRKNISMGAGVRHLLAQGVAADFSIYHKPGYHVTWEEVGLNQFRVRIKGDPSYSSRPPYRVHTDAAKVLIAFEDWAKNEYPKYAVDDGTWVPTASMNVLRVGRADRPNWSSAIAELYCDIRSRPGEPPIRAAYLFDDVMERICAGIPGIDAEWEMVAAMQAGRTEPTNWIVQSAIRGAQSVDGDQSDVYVGRKGGQTEMGLLQTLGIASAGVRGFPDHLADRTDRPADLRGGFTLSGAYAPYIVNAAKTMIYAAVDTLTRTREEVGLEY
jgi:acetylornithine deacetylase/succinyl-diaminopimelate desuccinylase-like protein